MRTLFSAMSLMAIAIAGCWLKADTLAMKDNKVLTGKYLGGTAQTVRFQTGAITQIININDVAALTFSGSDKPAPPANLRVGSPGQLGAISSGTNASTDVMIPAGTRVTVRMDDAIDSSRDTAGKRFSGKLHQRVTVGGQTIVPAGSVVMGQLAQQAGQLAGQPSLELALTHLVLNGEGVPLFTDEVTTARRAGGGAIAIGNGRPIAVVSGAVLEFRLAQPITIKK